MAQTALQSYQAVFRRVEKKYLLDRGQRAALLQYAELHMEADRYGHYPICSLYLDTEDYHLIRTSLEKPLYKEKLRLRSYGVPGRESPVFLELKKKVKGVTYKRRASLPLWQAEAVLQGDMSPSDQILREIAWAVERYHPVPKVLISYDRTAFSGRGEEAGLRLTLDTALRWREEKLCLSDGDEGIPLLPPDITLMEIKTPASFPLWLCHALSELEIYPVSFSKYGACYRQHLLGRQASPDTTGGIICA